MRTSIVDIPCMHQDCPSHTLSDEDYEKAKGDSWRIAGPLGESWSRFKKEGDAKYRCKHILKDDHVSKPEWKCCACGKPAEFRPDLHWDGPSYPYHNSSIEVTFTDKHHERQYAKQHGLVEKDYKAKHRHSR
jgi:hypothetical protein